MRPTVIAIKGEALRLAAITITFRGHLVLAISCDLIYSDDIVSTSDPGADG
jgi:hypothetical protein